ncbi:MAG: ATP-binding protein [Caldimonas sp.]
MLKLPNSLQGRLLVLVLGLVVAVWMVTVATTWLDVRQELDELLDSHLAQAAALLVVQQARDLEGDDHGVDAPTLHRYAPKVAFQVFHEGRLTLRSSNAPARPMIDSARRAETGFRTTTIDGTAWRVFAAHGAERDVQVFVGEQVQSRNSIRWAVRRGTAPLRKLGRTLAGRKPQVLHPVVLDGAPSEMVPTLDALNGLFGRIAELMESERRFTADAAHELRTPIAAIRAQAQVALGEGDDAQRNHALRATVEGCDRATRLVEQLLTLSRLEAGTAPALAAVELGAVVRQVVADLAPQALRARQVIEVDVGEPCPVQADATLLAVLVRNLVDNAIRYSPREAKVKVAVARRQSRVLLSVDDSGPGILQADLDRVGERFFRVIGNEQSGSGLGWSIIRRIAVVLDATVRVGRSSFLGGLSVEVEFSAQGQDAAG